MNNIVLPAPVRTGGMPIMDAFSKRATQRNYDPTKELDLQTLSNLLWSAWGFNRADRRTAPTSHNRQEVDLYVSLRSGTYLYDAAANTLVMINGDDLRMASAMQDYVADAPVNLIIVSDTTKIIGKTPQGVTEAIYANAGFISENIYMFCAAFGLGSVTRALVPKEELAKKMNLRSSQVITLVHTVGYTLD